MSNLKEAPLKEVAQRMRDVAAGLSNPSDFAAAEAYARELEKAAARERAHFTLGDPSGGVSGYNPSSRA